MTGVLSLMTSHEDRSENRDHQQLTVLLVHGRGSSSYGSTCERAEMVHKPHLTGAAPVAC